MPAIDHPLIDRFLDALMAEIAPLMASRGGPVVALQVENEYGSFGDDKTYLRHLADGLRRRGGDCLLFTSDGPSDLMLSGGTLPDILKVANFGSKAAFPPKCNRWSKNSIPCWRRMPPSSSGRERRPAISRMR